MQDHADQMDWSQFIRERRVHLGLRQDEVAALAGISTRSVHALETGKSTIRLDVILAVVTTLGLALSIASPAGSVTITAPV